MSSAYRILDEPRPGALSHLAVRPFWPLLGLMLGGFWLALPWFVFNGIAVGSPTRGREILISLGGLAGAAALTFGIFALDGAGWIDSRLEVKLALLVVLVWKLGVAYALCMLQSRSFELYEHFGGRVRNGLLVVLAALWLGPRLFAQLDLPLFATLVLR